ncbi:MAG: tetratricopeptide repeat protein, partial [Verrucomicrobia bacterium]|nr:tetratricopeptide repeat protein [Cytophagales bacterium]
MIKLYFLIGVFFISLFVHAQTTDTMSLRMKQANEWANNDQKDSAKIAYQALMKATKSSKQISIFAEASQKLGILLYYEGKHQQALDVYLEAIKYLETQNYLKGIADLYNELATLYKKHKDYALADSYFRKALTYAQQINDFEGIGNASNNLCLLFRETQNYSQALLWGNRGLENYQKAHSLVGQGYSLEYIGGVYGMMKKPTLAEKYLLQSLEIRLKQQD